MTNLEKLRKLMQRDDIDVCLITDTKQIEYYTGAHYSVGERLIVLKVKQTGTPELFLNQLFPAQENENYTVISFSDTDNIIPRIAADFKYCKVAVDKNWPVHFFIDMQKYSSCLFVNGTIIDEVRAVKQADEIEKMREASRRNDAVMAKVSELIQLGKSEKQLADEIVEAFREIAESEISFETIVAYGDHGADCHAVPSDRILKEGENVIVDMGCLTNGYCSDMTRTFFVNYNSHKEIYDTVLKANLAGIAAVKPGVRFKDIDAAARKVIEDAGYGRYFVHRLGHGIGMEVHEPFDVSGTDEVIVKEGMCFSIEPGIYIPGEVGVRIEDLVCVTKDGCEVLNHYPKDQEVLVR